MMLSMNQRVADEAHMTHNMDELLTGHGRPKVTVDVPVIDL